MNYNKEKVNFVAAMDLIHAASPEMPVAEIVMELAAKLATDKEIRKLRKQGKDMTLATDKLIPDSWCGPKPSHWK